MIITTRLQSTKRLRFLFSAACAVFVSGFFFNACSPAPDYAAIEALPIKNLSRPESNLFAAGQPTKAEFEALAKAGLKHVVNLRPRSEQADFDQAAPVQSLGMRYHAVPVAGAAGLTTENATRLAEVLESIGDEPGLVHCSSANRVGGLIAIQEFRSADADIEAALKRGRAWGLNRLEDAVRERLAQPDSL